MSAFASHPHHQYLSSNSLALWNVNCVLNQKDSRWLQLEVCREFQRNRCSRSDAECKFAHPATNVEVQNGKVTACYDSIKGRCNRDKPPCKYFHPPQHLKDQLLITGRNHLALKNALMTQMGLVGQQQQQQQQQLLPGQIQTVSSPYMTTLPQLQAAYPSTPPGAAAGPFLPGAPLNHTPTILHSADLSPTSNAGTPSLALFQQPQQLAAVAAQTQAQQQAKPRSDRIEVCRDYQRGICKVPGCRYAHPSEEVAVAKDGTVVLCMDHEKRKCFRDTCKYFHRPIPGSSSSSCPPSPPPPYLPTLALMATTTASLTLPNIVPYKRPASSDKSGQPIYHPHHQSQAYQHALMQIQQPPFVPVTYTTPPAGLALPRYQ